MQFCSALSVCVVNLLARHAYEENHISAASCEQMTRSPQKDLAHQLPGNLATFASEPPYVIWGDAGIPVVPRLQQGPEAILVALPVGHDIGILPHLMGRQLKGLGKAHDVA